MEYFAGLKISASGMQAERMRMDLVSGNIANSSSPETPDNPLYTAKRLITAPTDSPFGTLLAGFKEFPATGVHVVGVAQENSAPNLVYDPAHPAADEKGYVKYPNINVLDEMVEAISASRSYEANLTAFNETKKMFNNALDIGK